MINKIFKSRYKIIALYDSGGMSDVYKGLDIKSGKEVAVKILKPEFSSNREYVIRFQKEARAVASLKHKNIVKLLDSGCVDKIYFIIFEFIDGPNLKQKIKAEVKIDYTEATKMMIDICSAIEYAHLRGVVHRDIKPQNILIQNGEVIKISDFGIAKNIQGTTILNENTEVMGSAHYFSPEQAMGEKVDVRSDIYSLGIVLYEMVTGTLPFDAETSIAVAIKHINEPITEPKDVSDIPKSLNSIILKATRKDRDKRYSNVKQLKEDLMRSLVNPDGNFVKIMKEQSNAVPKRSRLSLVTFLIVSAIVLGTVLIVGSSIFNLKNQNTIIAPSLIGQTETEASDYALRIGLKINKVYESSDTVDRGIVISQNPLPEKPMEKDAMLTIYICDGPVSFETPQLVNQDLESAKVILEERGLVLGDITYEDSEESNGYVIAQQPEAGISVSRGDTVNLTLSLKSSDFAVMPLVKEMKFDDAVYEIANAGFLSVLVYEEESQNEEGKVLDQQPVFEVSQNINTMTKLWIAKFAEKTYSAVISVDCVVEEDDTLVLIVLETKQDGINVNYVLHEDYHKSGELKMPLEITHNNVEEEQNLVVYFNGKETLRRAVELK